MRAACVIGAGPNGLAAAIVLAQMGLHVDVYESEPQPGGGARTLELKLPGFLHDFGSAVHPLAVASPFFSSLPLQDYQLEWIHSPVPLAHPLTLGGRLIPLFSSTPSIHESGTAPAQPLDAVA
jgi:phytoene dehydrogenase-like protein